MLQPTFGTTGRSKLVMRTHKAFVRVAALKAVGLRAEDEPPQRCLLVAALTHGMGQYWLATAQGPDYLHGQLSAIATLTPAWELRATVHDTDSAAKRLFPGNAGGRWELALQGSF